MKTHSESGVLFYNTGPSSNKDFVALEIWKGLPRLLLDQVTRGRYLYDVGTGRGGVIQKETEWLPECNVQVRVQNYQNF